MKKYSNIENKRRHFDGRSFYVGYSEDGRSWCITGRSGYWTAKADLTKTGSISLLMGFDSLCEISDKLQQIK